MVKSITIEGVTSGDGKLQLGTIDTGFSASRVKVRLLIDNSPNAPGDELGQWNAFVDATEGRVDDPTFHRQPQGIWEPPPRFDDE